MAKFCAKCKVSFPEKENFCMKCGAPLRTEREIRRDVMLEVTEELLRQEKGIEKEADSRLSDDGLEALDKLKSDFQKLTPEFKRFFELSINVPDRNEAGILVELLINGMRSGDYKYYIAFLEKIVVHVPDDIFLWNLLEGGYVETDQMDKAAKCAEKILELNPNDVDAWERLGGMYSVTLKFDDSIRCFEKALEFKPNDSNLLKGLSMVYEIKTDKENAIKYLMLYLENNPNDKAEKKRLKALKKGKSDLLKVGEKIKQSRNT